MEFEDFFHQLDKQHDHISAEEKDLMKTKVRQTCENYYTIKNSTKIDEIIERLDQMQQARKKNKPTKGR